MYTPSNNSPPKKVAKVLPWSKAVSNNLPDFASEEETKTYLTLRNKALLWLARREYSEKELISRLLKEVPSASSALANAVVLALTKEGLQSDRRYVAAKIQAQSKKFGWQRISHELKIAGIDKQLMLSVREECNEEEPENHEINQALLVICKKSSSPPTDAAARAKLIRFMQGRGFSWEVTLKALKLQKERAENEE